MSDLRKAAQMALEVLVHYSGDDGIYHYAGLMDAITALRAALAQPERKPLTDEEMRLCFTSTNTSEPLSEGWPGLERFARAIEREHGIGGEE